MARFVRLPVSAIVGSTFGESEQGVTWPSACPGCVAAVQGNVAGRGAHVTFRSMASMRPPPRSSLTTRRPGSPHPVIRYRLPAVGPRSNWTRVARWPERGESDKLSILELDCGHKSSLSRSVDTSARRCSTAFMSTRDRFQDPRFYRAADARQLALGLDPEPPYDPHRPWSAFSPPPPKGPKRFYSGQGVPTGHFSPRWR